MRYGYRSPGELSSQLRAVCYGSAGDNNQADNTPSHVAEPRFARQSVVRAIKATGSFGAAAWLGHAWRPVSQDSYGTRAQTKFRVVRVPGCRPLDKNGPELNPASFVEILAAYKRQGGEHDRGSKPSRFKSCLRLSSLSRASRPSRRVGTPLHRSLAADTRITVSLRRLQTEARANLDGPGIRAASRFESGTKRHKAASRSRHEAGK